MPEVEFTFSCPGCCGDGAGWEVQCRSRTGTATLCGYSEYTSPSTPPKKYKLKTLAGAIRQISHDDLACAGDVIGTLEYVYSGSCHYDPSAGCALIENGMWELLFNGSLIASGETCSVSTFICSANQVLSPKQKSFTPQTPCAALVSSSNECVTSATETLSEEDTEEAAMARVAAEWTEWGNGGCCTSKTARGAGEFTFGFSESEYRIRVKGAPGQVITLYIWFTETGIDGEFYEVRQFVADGKEFGEWSQAFPIAASSGSSCCLSRITRYTS